MKYIDADLLRKDIDNWKAAMIDAVGEYSDGVRFALEHFTFVLDSLQQDKKSVELELCSQTWWEERGWIMIPPDATIEGIDSLLKQVRKKLQQEQPEVDLDVDETEKDSLNKLIAKCREGRDCKAAWEFYTKAKIEEARKEEEE